MPNICVANFLLVFAVIVSTSACSTAPKSSLPASFTEFVESGQHQADIKDLNRYLLQNRVHNVVPINELLQQGSDWRANGLPRYALPPKSMWPQMVRTLKFLRRFLLPSIGPFEVVSGFRTPAYNTVAGGATKSQHLQFSALDIVPKTKIDRRKLHYRLTAIWKVHGKRLNVGLGLYSGTRFHIDTGGYRKWQG